LTQQHYHDNNGSHETLVNNTVRDWVC